MSDIDHKPLAAGAAVPGAARVAADATDRAQTIQPYAAGAAADDALAALPEVGSGLAAGAALPGAAMRAVNDSPAPTADVQPYAAGAAADEALAQQPGPLAAGAAPS